MTAEKFKEMKADEEGSLLASQYESEIQAYLEHLKKVVSEGFGKLASGKSSVSDRGDSVLVNSSLKEKSAAQSQSASGSLLGGDN